MNNSTLIIGKGVKSALVKKNAFYQQSEEPSSERIKRLESLEQKFSLLVANMEESFLLTDKDFTIVSFNDQFERLYQLFYGRTIVKGHSILEHSLPSRVEAVSKTFEKVFQGHIQEVESNYVHPEGGVYTFLSKYKPAYNEKGEVIGVFIVITDITAAKKAQNELSQSEDKYRSIVENSLNAFVFTASDGMILDVNKATIDMFGYSLEEFQKLRKQDIIDYSDKDFITLLKERNESGKSKGDCIGIRKNGERFACEFSSIIYKDVNGENRGCTFLSDISARKANEHKIEQSEIHLKAIFENTSESFLLMDTDFTIKALNNKAKEYIVFGTPEDVKVGTNAFDFIEESLKGTVAAMYKTVLDGETIQYDRFYEKENGNKLWISFIVNPVREGEEIKGICITGRDFTPRKLAIEELQKKELRFRSLIENSHDMLTLFNAEGKIEYLSPAVERTFGYSNEEKGTIQMVDIVHSDDIPIIEAQFKEVFANPGVPICSTIRNKKKDGSYIWVEGSITNMFDIPGVNAIVANFRDVTEIKKNEETLAEAHKRFIALVENGADGIAILMADGKPAYISPTIGKMLGYTYDEAMQLDLFAVTHPDDITLVERIWGKVLESPGVLIDGGICRMRHKDGSWHWLEGTFTNMLHDSSIRGIVNNFRDITTRVLAEKEKEFERRDKEALINNTNDTIWSVSKEFKLIAGNRSFIESIRQTTGVILVPGDDLLMKDYFYPEFIAFWKEIYLRALRGESFTEEVYTPKLGELPQNWAAVNFNPIMAGEQIVGVACYGRNITEQKLLKEHLTESEAKFRAAFQFSAIGMAILNPTGQWLSVNESLCKIVGYNKEELLNLTFQDITHPDDLDTDLVYLKQLMNGERETYQMEKRYIHAKKHIVWVYLAVSVVRDKDYQPIYFIAQIEDITQRKRDEFNLIHLNKTLNQRAEELAFSNAELEQFAYVASHDLQEPLRMVTSFLTQLEKKYKEQLDEKARQYIHFAVDGAIRMRKIILDLLEYSKVGKEAHEVELIDMNDLLNEIVQKNIVKEEGIVIEWEELPTIHGAKLPISQVMQNLLSNALKYRKAEIKPRVLIKASDNTKEWLFSVSDNGIGIDAQFFDKIFVLFQRLHNKNEYSGTGIGLAICKKIIDNHKGKIWVESKFGQGSTFYFTISK